MRRPASFAITAALFAAGVTLRGEISWPRIAPHDAGFDPARLEELRADLASRRTTALLVLRYGRVALEWYAPGADADRPHYTASMAKGLVGGGGLLLAVDDRRVAVDDLASKFIPSWRDDPRKSRITLRQLATHSSGIEDAEQDGRPHAELPGWKGAFWRREPDPFSIALAQAPLVFEPGTSYQYSNPGMAALGYALTAAYRGAEHADLRRLLSARIMTPLGIPESEWSIGYGRAYRLDGLDLYAPWGGGSFTPRAVARVGELLLHRGLWQGRSLIRRTSVERAVAAAGTPLPPRTAADPAPAPGLGFWSNSDGVWAGVPRDAFAAAGAGHQILLVVPSLDLVAVRMGEALEPGAASYWGPAYERFLRPLAASVARGAPYPPSPAVGSVEFAPPESITRSAIDSDNWPITWGDDDAQYTSYGDGFGFEPGTEKKLSLGLARITGPPERYHAENLRSQSAERAGDGRAGPKASGMLMAGGVLYMWVRNTGNAQLAWSEDRGRTWAWGFKLDTGFGSPAFLNFGANYAGGRDGWVYAYSQDGASAYESDDFLVLARAPKGRLRDRSAWEFFAGTDGAGGPRWTPDIAARQPVFRHVGRCQRVDAVYNPGLRRYLLALGYDHHGGWGIFDAPEPWGPWTTVFHTDNWGLGGTHGYRLPAKWISADGRTLWLVFSGAKGPGLHYDAFSLRRVQLHR
jgi:CubicO group peptidase (beta-lactamase class C family)